MNRRGNGALISDVISTLREDIPDLVLRTSLLV